MVDNSKKKHPWRACPYGGLLIIAFCFAACSISRASAATIEEPKVPARGYLQIHHPSRARLTSERIQPLQLELKKIIRRENRKFLSLNSRNKSDNRRYPNTIESTYQISQLSDIISAQLNISATISSNHPREIIRTLNYHIPSNKFIRLIDLFESEEFDRALQTISQYSRQALKKRLDPQGLSPSIESWIFEGSEPTPDNYKHFMLTEAGLEITFETYQIACYAEGQPTVIIPWKLLDRYLLPQFSKITI